MNIIEFLPEHIKENVICIYQTGSQLFCDKCKDKDFVIISKKHLGRSYYIAELNADCFIYTVEELENLLQSNSYRFALAEALAIRQNGVLIYGEFPNLNIDITSREYLLNALKNEYEYGCKVYFNNTLWQRKMVWGLALYYVLTNYCFYFTEQQKTILQKCHDGELEQSYANELKANMERLLNS